MRLFAFTREEGSDERNPWAILLQRRRAWLRDGVTMAVSAGVVLFLTHGEWRRAGIFCPAPITAFAVGVIGGLIHVSSMWQRILKSPLLVDSDVTPQRGYDLRAALEWRTRRWLVFVGALSGAAFLNAYAHLAWLVAPDFPLLLAAHAVLFAGTWFAAWAFVYAVMGWASSGTFISNSKPPLERLGCGCTGGLILVTLLALSSAAIAVLNDAISDSIPLALPFFGRMSGAGGVSMRALITTPAMASLILGAAGTLLWLIGRAFSRGPFVEYLDSLRRAVARERSRKTKWLF